MDTPEAATYPPKEMRWWCTVCGESVTHQHRPKKPTYEELLSVLGEVRTALMGTAFAESHTYALVRVMLERAEHGR